MTDDQIHALEAMRAYLADRSATESPFLLSGGAGTGKTWLLAELIRRTPLRPILVAAYTHKATNVLRRKLAAAGIEYLTAEDLWARRFDEDEDKWIVTGTTHQTLGLHPVIREHEDGTELHFGGGGCGLYRRLEPSLVIIDEVSMLPRSGIAALHREATQRGGKIIVIGDDAQLPPVKDEAIDFASFAYRAELRQIVRQEADSAIVALAWKIRDGSQWTSTVGKGIRRASKPISEFVGQVESPGDRPEEERTVLIAYTNEVVNTINEKCCRRLYGHGRDAFAAGELVLSESTVREREIGICCARNDELIVEAVGDRDWYWGIPITLHRRAGGPTFTRYYFLDEDRRNPAHPYNAELRRRHALALRLQHDWERGAKDLDFLRRDAWTSYFDWRNTPITLRHPFAITSHKSQGSTYRRVYAVTGDLARFGRAPLYVAVTRPKEELVIPGRTA